MSIIIEIKDDQIKDLVDFYSGKQKALREQIAKLEKDLRNISATISQLKQRMVNPDTSAAYFLSDQEIFSPKWPWVKKIAYAINEAGKPATTKEIVDILEIYEPKSEEERKSAISSVSSTLSVKSGKYSEKRDFIKSVSETGEFAYSIWSENKAIERNLEQFGTQIIINDLPF